MSRIDLGSANASLAGDRALAIANFVFRPNLRVRVVFENPPFRRGAEKSERGARAPQMLKSRTPSGQTNSAKRDLVAKNELVYRNVKRVVSCAANFWSVVSHDIDFSHHRH